MTPIPDWRGVLRTAWSVRLMILAAVLSGLEVGLPLVRDAWPIPDNVFAALSGVTVAAAFVARLIAQNPPEEAP